MKLLRMLVSTEVKAVTDKVLEDAELQDKIYGDLQTMYYYDIWQKIKSASSLNIIERIYVANIDEKIKRAVRRRQLLAAVFALSRPEPSISKNPPTSQVATISKNPFASQGATLSGHNQLYNQLYNPYNQLQQHGTNP